MVDWVKIKAKQARIDKDLKNYDRQQQSKNLARTAKIAESQGKSDVASSARKKLSDIVAPVGSGGTYTDESGRQVQAQVVEIGGKKYVLGVTTPQPQSDVVEFQGTSGRQGRAYLDPQGNVVGVNDPDRQMSYAVTPTPLSRFAVDRPVYDQTGRVVGYESGSLGQSVMLSDKPPVQESPGVLERPMPTRASIGIASPDRAQSFAQRELTAAEQRFFKRPGVIDIFTQGFRQGATLDAETPVYPTYLQQDIYSVGKFTGAYGSAVMAAAGVKYGVPAVKTLATAPTGSVAADFARRAALWGAGTTLAGIGIFETGQTITALKDPELRERYWDTGFRERVAAGLAAQENNPSYQAEIKAIQDARAKAFAEFSGQGGNVQDFGPKFTDKLAEYYQTRGYSPEMAKKQAEIMGSAQYDPGSVKRSSDYLPFLKGANFGPLSFDFDLNQVSVLFGSESRFREGFMQGYIGSNVPADRIERDYAAALKLRQYKGYAELPSQLIPEIGANLAGVGQFNMILGNSKVVSTAAYQALPWFKRAGIGALSTAAAGAFVEAPASYGIYTYARGKEFKASDLAINVGFGALTSAPLGAIAGIGTTKAKAAALTLGYTLDFPNEILGDALTVAGQGAVKAARGFRAPVLANTNIFMNQAPKSDAINLNNLGNGIWGLVPQSSNIPSPFFAQVFGNANMQVTPRQGSRKVASYVPQGFSIPQIYPAPQTPVKDGGSSVPSPKTPDLFPSPIYPPTVIPPSNINITQNVSIPVLPLTPSIGLPPPIPLSMPFGDGSGWGRGGSRGKFTYFNELSFGAAFLRSSMYSFNNAPPQPKKKKSSKPSAGSKKKKGGPSRKNSREDFASYMRRIL